MRTAQENEAGHIAGAVNIHFGELEARIDEISALKKSVIVVYCERGIRANIAEATLREAGFESIVHLQDDIFAWRKNGLPLE
ncbi:rhodanese-like domain-containing protein [Romeria aff. gracilis LEGE 07310]|uniref:Rhodanese-like domain-containing protein n=1 Tax=Vasconcelosia minhoensis LEGE 07310 TaxID=915328 RepID=A0A8J7AXU8_9CYAN|nr:rhodanese-like domain-containing protein [Romeria gracilis]MBE9078102.1 rhodanese-like domain-containing protein [Romeria aff. gracilis LEGE 07310]